MLQFGGGVRAGSGSAARPLRQAEQCKTYDALRDRMVPRGRRFGDNLATEADAKTTINPLKGRNANWLHLAIQV